MIGMCIFVCCYFKASFMFAGSFMMPWRTLIVS